MKFGRASAHSNFGKGIQGLLVVAVGDVPVIGLDQRFHFEKTLEISLVCIGNHQGDPCHVEIQGG